MRHQREHRTRKWRPNLNNKNHNNISENLCRIALELAVSRKELDFFISAKHSDEVDSAHIDIILVFKKKIVPIQIKGCFDAAERHKARWPHIPCHVVPPHFSRQRIHILKAELLAIFHSQPFSCEKFLDESVITIIRRRIEAEGFKHMSPF